MAYDSDNIVVNTKPRPKKGAEEETGKGKVSFELERDGDRVKFPCFVVESERESSMCSFVAVCTLNITCMRGLKLRKSCYNDRPELDSMQDSATYETRLLM
jgi:hypothetical protein